MTWKESHDKYKNYKLPQVGEVFNHPSQYRGDRLPIEFKVLEYVGENGIVETVHSKYKQKKTLHWIRKTYNRE